MPSAEYRALVRERFLHEKVRGLLITQGWMMFQSLAFIGIAVFSLILATGGLVQVASWFTFMQGIELPWPAASFGFSEFANASASMPSPRVLEALSKFPLWGIKDATVTALVVMVVILVFRLWKGFRLWRDVRTIKQTIRELDQELETLRQSADDDER